jgi:hypothetical protein
MIIRNLKNATISQQKVLVTCVENRGLIEQFSLKVDKSQKELRARWNELKDKIGSLQDSLDYSPHTILVVDQESGAIIGRIAREEWRKALPLYVNKSF